MEAKGGAPAGGGWPTAADQPGDTGGCRASVVTVGVGHRVGGAVESAALTTAAAAEEQLPQRRLLSLRTVKDNGYRATMTLGGHLKYTKDTDRD